MKAEEIDKLTEEEAKHQLKIIHCNVASVKVYLTIEEKLMTMADKFDQLDIDLDSDDDDKKFKRFMDFSAKAEKLEESNIKRREKLDENVLLQERANRKAAGKGTLESFVNKRSGKTEG